MLNLLRPLGEGGMGKVWVARHRGLETEVVVKFLAASGADRAEAEARFAREAAAAAAVKSPHVVQVFDHGTTPDGTRYIVMELLEGRDLARHIAENGPMAPRDAAAVIAQVAKALSRAHQAGVIHRDIKPENVFLCDGDGGEMFVKVLDFGIAKREEEVSSKTSTGQVIGTPYYMSPEQLLADRPIDARTDIWSLGVVAFEALTGKRPFDGATVGSITLAIHTTKPKPSAIVPSLSPSIDEWFARACARAPEERFATVREAGQAMLNAVGDTYSSGQFRAPTMSIVDLNDAVAAATAGREQPRSTAVPPESFPPVSGRSPPKLALGGAVLAILALVGIFVLTQRRTEAHDTHDNVAASPSVLAATATVAPPASSPAPAASSAEVPAAVASAPATSPPTTAAAFTPHPKATSGHPTTRTARPPRKRNDDDIK